MIPFVDLKAQYESIKEEIQAAIAGVLETSQFILGNEVKTFEEEFACYCEADYGIAVNSGTSALHLALLANGIGPGDEVITVSFTFIATAAAIGYTGATPVFVDIDPLTRTMDVQRIESAITERTKAILPVHLYGQPVDMDAVLEIAQRHGLIVIEDAAQAHGARYQGRRVGGIGHMGCLSFYPSKNLGAYGEGGIVITNDPELARTVRKLRDWGQEQKYDHALRGFNYRMDGLQGAILRVKLRYLDEWTEARRAHAGSYDSLLADSGLTTPSVMPHRHHVYHIYAVQSRQRDRLHEKLNARGVQSCIHYPTPLHLQTCYSDLGYRLGDLPYSEQAAASVLSLPMYAELSLAQIEVVAEHIRKLLQETEI